MGVEQSPNKLVYSSPNPSLKRRGAWFVVHGKPDPFRRDLTLPLRLHQQYLRIVPIRATKKPAWKRVFLSAGADGETRTPTTFAATTSR